MYFKVYFIGNVLSIGGHELKTPILGDKSKEFYFVVNSKEELDEEISILKGELSRQAEITETKIEEYSKEQFFNMAKNHMMRLGLKLYALNHGLSEAELEDKREEFLNDEVVVGKATAALISSFSEYMISLPKKPKLDTVS